MITEASMLDDRCGATILAIRENALESLNTHKYTSGMICDSSV